MNTTRKQFVLAILFLLSTISGTMAASHRGFGVGIIIGDPTGLSFKKWLSDTRAWDAAVAWSFGRHDAFHLHADYLFHSFSAIKLEKNTIPLYYGIGGRIKFEDQSKVGVRFPLGVEFFFREVPIDFFFEVVPILNLAPATDLDLNAAIGLRYFFP
jgi:hypothetical protein